MPQQTVLLVDDDPDVISGLRLALRKEDFDVRCASSGEQAFKVLRGQLIDLVIADHEMPGMKGTEFLNKVQEEFPDVVRFMLTGYASMEMVIEAINKGAITRFFVKPFNAADLAANIRQALQQRELLRQTRRLLRKVQHQEAMLEQMEREHPGITSVVRSATGSIVLDEAPDDHEALLKKLDKVLEQEL